MRKIFLHVLALCLLLSFTTTRSLAQARAGGDAPGAPGRDAHWESAGKQGVGTSNTLESKVWFTLRGGVLTEIYYPTVDVAATQALQFVVVSGGNRRVETEAEDATHRVEVADARSLTFRQINTAKSGAWTITKTYIADPRRHTVLVEVFFTSRPAGAHTLYVYHDPSLANSGMHDAAWTQDGALLASEADKASALVSGVGFNEMTNGYLGTSDGLTQLRRAGRLTPYARAADGNVVQVASLPRVTKSGAVSFTLALAFGKEPREALSNARASLAAGFRSVRAEYETGWHEYLGRLRRVAPKVQAQFDMAAMVLKAHEDKTYRGAMIASLSVPWGGGASANEPEVGGYHLVWSRDLYQVATAFHALGDKASAERALNYLFTVQQKADGSFPQNSWLDGRPFWGSLQHDEVAYPLILAQQLGRTDRETYVKHVRPAADFIVRTGPWTPQERWEEESGYSPSTIAAEIAGLVCAAEIARRHDDHASEAIYLAAADEWARNVEQWTATSTGKHGDGNYYLRITGDGDPNDGSLLELNNGAGSFDEREIVDAGFLELVRLGIKPAADPLVAKSLAVIDRRIKVETPGGASFYRYNHDGYGEMDDGRPWNFDGKYTGKGRLWALLAGERGEYELARAQAARARLRLDAMLGFANEGRMIPEQVWDKPQTPRPDFSFGEGTGSATPLAWSMAQFIRLAASLREGRNVALPEAVAARYARRATPPARADVSFNAPDERELKIAEAGKSIKLAGRVARGGRAYLLFGGERRELKTDESGRYEFEFVAPAGESQVVVGTNAASGATSFHRVSLRALTPEERRKAEGEQAPPRLLERIRNAKTSPLIDGDRVTFVYRGRARRVEVVGDFTSWSPRSLVMREAPGSDVKYYTREFARDARAEYKLIADGEWMLDPLNSNRNDNGVGGENSNFAMPGYRPSAYVVEPRDINPLRASSGGRMGEAGSNVPDISTPTFVLDEVPSKILGGSRKINVFLPRSYANSNEALPLPVLYVQDGSEYIRRAQAAIIADKLIEQKKVAPFIIVFVDPADRMKDYWASDQFADFMARELVPFIDARFRTQPRREGRALIGASLGGVTSIWAGLKHPEVFSRVGAQSSALQIDDERVVSALNRLAPAGGSGSLPLRFYMDVGRMEPVLDAHRRVRVMLRAKGYPVTYRELEAGHNYTAWRDLLADALIALWK
ncbi:MAG TPA: glucan 1,4-alpha-glucosidase [Pyrinomonadaceae bacterium]